MSHVTYHGIQMPNALITSFRQEAVGDDLSDTDWVYMKIDMTCQFVINANHIPLLNAAPDNNADTEAPSLFFTQQLGDNLQRTSIANIIEVIRKRLLVRRKPLSVKMNGVELIPQPPLANGQAPNAGFVDARNGPIPISCTPIQLNNTSVMFVWHVTAHYWQNNNFTQPGVPITNATGNTVLFNRWSELADIDSCNYATRTRTGKIVIRSDNTEGAIADQVRSQMAVVGVPPGFLRKASQYQVDPSGLGLAYQVTDKEVFKKPPTPAFEAEGEYIESCSLDGGYQRYCEVRVALKADKVTSQVDLLETAMAVASSKLAINGAPIQDLSADPAHPAILQSMAAKVWMYENAVEVNMRALKAGTRARRNGVASRLFVTTPFSESTDNVPTPKYLDYGTSGYLVKAAAYYDPNLTTTVLDRALGQLSNGVAVGTAGKVANG